MNIETSDHESVKLSRHRHDLIKFIFIIVDLFLLSKGPIRIRENIHPQFDFQRYDSFQSENLNYATITRSDRIDQNSEPLEDYLSKRTDPPSPSQIFSKQSPKRSFETSNQSFSVPSQNRIKSWMKFELIQGLDLLNSKNWEGQAGGLNLIYLKAIRVGDSMLQLVRPNIFNMAVTI